jgi:hypothetical protein
MNISFMGAEITQSSVGSPGWHEIKIYMVDLCGLKFAFTSFSNDFMFC